jgi:hypothetical protein
LQLNSVVNGDLQIRRNNGFALKPGLPDGLFSNQNPNLGKFFRVLQGKTLICFMAIWSNLIVIWFML